MGRALGYFIKQGFKNIRTHRLVSLASVGIVAASLLLLGIFLLLEMNLESVLTQLQDQYEINIYLEETVSAPRREELKTALQGIDGVKELRYYSREERLRNVKENAYKGKEYLLEDFETDNPLRDSFVITLEEIEQSTPVAEKAERLSGVDEVTNMPELTNKIQRFADGAERIGLWMMLLFALAAVFIISNTIRMGMAARSREIEIMHFVGASPSYVRGPFLVEGLILGLVGALLASGLILWGYSAVAEMVQNTIPVEILKVVNPWDAGKVMLPCFLILGVGIGLFGSGFSVHKYRK